MQIAIKKGGIDSAKNPFADNSDNDPGYVAQTNDHSSENENDGYLNSQNQETTFARSNGSIGILAISDLLLLISGLPPEMYYIWSKYPYIFGEAFCVLQGFAAETSANATVLTITAFTVERYIAICHPFLSHTMSKLSRVIKLILIIWLFAVCLAIPQAMSFGIVYENLSDGISINEDHNTCNVKRMIIPHAFLISTVLFFVAPMSLITVLYILIGLQLRQSPVGPVRGGSIKLNHLVYKKSLITHTNSTHQTSFLTNDNGVVDFQLSPQEEASKTNCSTPTSQPSSQHVIKMLVAVVVAFFICWAPFHAQRLLAIYGQSNSSGMVATLSALTYISGVLYYLSTTINPVLYHIMSHKFRLAFKETWKKLLGRKSKPKVLLRYSTLSGRPSIDKGNQTNETVLFKLQTTESLNKHFGNKKKTNKNKKSIIYLNSPLVNGTHKIKYVPCSSIGKTFIDRKAIPQSAFNTKKEASVVYKNHKEEFLVSAKNPNTVGCEVSANPFKSTDDRVYKRCNSCNINVMRRNNTYNNELPKSLTMPNVKHRRPPTIKFQENIFLSSDDGDVPNPILGYLGHSQGSQHQLLFYTTQSDSITPTTSSLPAENWNDNITNSLKTIIEQNNQVLEWIRKQNRTPNNAINNTLPEDIEVQFPLKHEDDIQKLEERLEKKNNWLALSSYLSFLGGRDSIGHTNNILKYLFTNTFATSWNFCGKRGTKKAFKKFKLKEVIISAVRKASPQVNERDIENYIKVWLKHVPERLKRETNGNS
ncbi:hypothetical protein RN001_006193 [Aquatica leii]|uniref:G-protein coupled receptors family 1 profile domain-containing protein n=1 Tax=Aquatica leii TaxID=1421715 RepID=A0AAN7Q1H6_9COLE|nr:hypothetical protein RN001_006193 [Aquatica leii]